jgi:uncharacterized protein (TIGR03790 family)
MSLDSSLRRRLAVLLFLTACSSPTETSGDAGGPPQGVADGAGDTTDAVASAMDGVPTEDGSTMPDAEAGADTGASLYPPRRSPDEVLVVLNTSSPTSMAIAQDYAQKRNVKNILSIQCADSALSANAETITLADYTASIATPMSQYLASHGGIQFIVLTKGIPIRIADASTGCCMNGGAPGQPSVDSTLAAIDYPTIPGATKLPITGSGTVGTGWLNRYWNATEPFTHEKFGGYLVTRLDGTTQADAMGLVTQALAAEQGTTAGPALFDVDINHGLGDKTMAPEPITAFDYDPTMGVTAEWDWSVWNADMLRAHDLMEASGIPNLLSMNGTFAGNLTNLNAYFSWGSNDSTFDPNAYESLLFAPGSVGDTAVSTSGRTFLPTSGGQSLVADLVAHGLTSGKGYVGEPLLQGVASPSIALMRYHSGYSMAESLYAASRFTGWEDVVLGDPLGTPYSGASPVVAPTYASQFDASSGGVQTESCAEGGLDVGNITDGSYTVYKSADLTGAKTLVVRVASAGAGGNVELHLDGPTGTVLGTCGAPVTGGWQTWTTQTCPLGAATGTHDLYLVFASGADGGGGFLFNLQWFALRP